MAGVTQRVKIIYAQHPRMLEEDVNQYLENMSGTLDGIKFDHGVTMYEGGERLTLYTAYILHHEETQYKPPRLYRDE